MASDGADAPTGRIPNLIIAGVSKGGTSSLFNYLAQHPDVCPADQKELRYFVPLRYGGALEPLESYTSHFRQCEQQRYAVEATPGYFYGGQPLARGLQQVCPAVHALVSLRFPADRCWSWFRFVKSRTRIPKEMTFDAYLDRCEELHQAGVDGEIQHQPFWGLGGGCYDEYIESWITELGDRFRVLFFDDIVSNPRETLRALCGWLGIDSAPVDAFDFPVENKTQQYRNRAIQRMAVSLNRRGEAFFLRHQSGKRALRGAYYLLNRAEPAETMSPAARARMTEFYQPHNDRLARQLAEIGVSLPSSWSEAL